MRFLRVALALVMSIPLVVIHPGVAGADCIGPTIEYAPTDVARGGLVSITGIGFGDNCYDTGPPPSGEGTLGNPLTDIGISLVQGDVEELVATGSADADYEFAVDVIVPASFAPGDVVVSVETSATIGVFSNTREPLTVSDAPPVESLGAEVAMFGPAVESGPSSGPAPESPGTIAEPSTSDVIDIDADAADDDSSPWVVIGAVVIAVILASGAWFARDRISRRGPT